MGDVTLPLLLSVDTATKCCAVALTRGDIHDGEIIASLVYNNNITHSRKLLSAIDALLNETETSWNSVDGLAVSLGPGSFTGLRIGMATLKGIATAANLPLYGVSTLDALAVNCVTDKRICSVLDARKKEVYTAFYRGDKSRKLIRETEIIAVTPELLAEEIAEQTLFVGDAVFLYRDLWKILLGDLAYFSPVQLCVPNPSNIGLLACEKHYAGDHLNIAEASPLYVRASDAELSLGKKA